MQQAPVYINLPLFVLGLLIIVKGSDLFLDNAVWIARASGVSQMIIGATVVSICTTLPEFVSSGTAAFKGAVDMALGNAVGSVICNTGLILGGTLLFVVARANREVFLIKGIFMLGTLLVGLVLLSPNPVELPVEGAVRASYRLDRSEGLVLLVLMVIYLVVNYYESIHTVDIRPGDDREEYAQAPSAPQAEWMRRAGLFCAGGVMVGFGAYLLVEFGQGLARNMGVKEAVISLVFVAFGTSLPELFTAISAVRKGAEQITIGNIFGANVLNMTMVTGTAAMIHPLAIDDQWLARLDVPVALFVCAAAFCSGVATGQMRRKTGIVLLTIYGAYLISMVAMGRIG